MGMLAGLAVGLLLSHWPSEGRVEAEPERPTAAAPPSSSTAPSSSPVVLETPAVRPAAQPEPAAAAARQRPEPPDAAPEAQQRAALPQPAAPTPEAETRPAWLRNAVAVPDPGRRPLIAIVIDDLGLDRVNTERVTRLPGPLTLSFMTYAGDLDRQTRAARAAGHELMVHVPMEPLDAGLQTGPNTLEVGLSSDELRSRLRWDLSRFDGYVGINNHMGSRFTAWKPGMKVVLDELRRRGLLFLDSRTIADTVGQSVAGQLGLPYVSRDVFLDNEASAEAVRAQLAKTEAIARKYGSVIAIGHPHDGTIEALREWLPTLAAHGFAQVPVSAIVRRNSAMAGGPS